MSEEAAIKDRKLFLGSLIVIAFLINSFFYSRQQPTPDFRSSQGMAYKSDSIQREIAPSNEAQLAAEAAAKEHERFIAKYVNPGFVRKPGVKTMAMVVSSNPEGLNRATEATLIAHFKPDSVELLQSLFTPEFVTDGLFSQAFVDAGPLSKKLELSKSIDLLLLVHYEVHYTTHESLNDVITADIELDITLAKIGTNEPNQVWRYTAKGAGFSTIDSRGMAEERLIKQLTKETSPTSAR